MSNEDSRRPAGTDCFVYILKPGSGERYDALHAQVWPEAREELLASGYVRYDIHRWGDLVITYTERDTAAATAVTEDVQARVDQWAELLAPLFVASTDRSGELLRAHSVFSLIEKGSCP